VTLSIVPKSDETKAILSETLMGHYLFQSLAEEELVGLSYQLEFPLGQASTEARHTELPEPIQDPVAIHPHQSLSAGRQVFHHH
jgi:hypothetical protein